MNNDFDFNINNYNLNELIDFFKLPFDYSLKDILSNEKNIKGIIIKNDKYDSIKKREFIQFINKAKERLVEKIKDTMELQKELDMLPEKDELLIKSSEKNIINQTTAEYSGNHYVMDRNTTSFNKVMDPKEYLNPIESFPTNIARSNLNNLKRKTLMQTIILNSLFREDITTSTSTDFNLVLPYYFKNILSMRLSSLQLPNVLYCFSKMKLNNIMNISEETTNLEKTIIIPDGNYSATDFVDILKTTINTLFNTVAPIDRFDVKIDNATQKITITNTTNNFTMNFLKNIEQIEFYKTLGWAMGYRIPLYSGFKSYITEGAYNGYATDYIFFVLNDYNNSQSENILAMYSKSYIGNNILAMVPLTTNSFQVCFNNGSDFLEKKREYFGPVNIQRLKIQLLNQYGEILDLNNMDFSFSLEFEVGYDW